MGGIGKTELALQYALHHLKERTYAGGLCWLRSREEVGTQIVSFARSQLSLEPPDGLELLDQVRWCWRNWQAGEILTVFDDVQKYTDVEPYLLPAGEPRFKVLMTTRRLRIAASVQDFEIKVLNEEPALALLRAIVADGRVDRDLETAKQLCEWLGWLPLGLELVGRYLARKKDVSLAKLWQRLQDKKLEAKALLEAEPGMTATLGVTAAFELSWQELNEEAQQLTAWLSLFAPAEIPWSVVQGCLPDWDEEDLEDLRDEKLVALSLLSRVGEGIYGLHQLLREFFVVKRSHVLDLEAAQRSFYLAIIAEADKAINTPEQSLLKETNAVLPHLAEASKQFEAAGNQEALASCFAWFALLYRLQGRYAEAELRYLQALEIYQRQLGADHLEVATNLNNLALLYRLQGRYAEAEPCYLQALEIRQRQLGADHPDLAVSLNNLAKLYESQGHYAEAELRYLQALASLQRQLGSDHPHVATSLNNLAGLYRLQGRYAEAEPRCMQALEIRQRQLGADHPALAVSLNNLALLYRLQGRYAEAEPRYVQALEIAQRQLGADHPEVATSLNNLALLYESQGRYAEAEPRYVQALEIAQRQLGADHLEVATNLNNLALLYRLQGRYAEAELRYLQALPILLKRLGENHPTTQTVWRNFLRFLQQVIQKNQTDELSNNSMTRSLLQQMQNQES
jgi:tetratricopeptide (TPR) repeat protein